MRKEIKLYNEELAARPWIVVANKMDIDGADERLQQLQARFSKTEVIAVSAQEGYGMDELRRRLAELVGSPAG